MSGSEQGGPAYVNAYLNGMQFILLALEGRIQEMEDPDKEELIAALYEYHEMASRMRDRSRLGVTP